MELIFRKANKDDVRVIVDIYERTHDAEEAGETTIGWIRGVYPTRDTAEAALDRDDMYVCDYDGKVIASAVINQIQVDVYEGANWEYEADDDKVLVLHTLDVDHDYKHLGVGRAFVEFYEKLALEQGCTVLRMDTNERNAIARKFYAKMGYREADVKPTVFNGIPGVNLILLEKEL